jgi:hypothetical protein
MVGGHRQNLLIQLFDGIPGWLIGMTADGLAAVAGIPLVFLCAHFDLAFIDLDFRGRCELRHGLAETSLGGVVSLVMARRLDPGFHLDFIPVAQQVR